MLAIAFRVLIFLLVLIQYTPLRICALEQLATGSNCHERSEAEHREDRDCNSGGTPHCVCEMPRVDAERQVQDTAIADCASAPIVVAVDQPSPWRFPTRAPDPDPQRSILNSLQLPLLI